MPKVMIKKHYAYRFCDGLKLASFKQSDVMKMRAKHEKLLQPKEIDDYALPANIQFKEVALPKEETSQTQFGDGVGKAPSSKQSIPENSARQ